MNDKPVEAPEPTAPEAMTDWQCPKCGRWWPPKTEPPAPEADEFGDWWKRAFPRLGNYMDKAAARMAWDAALSAAPDWRGLCEEMAKALKAASNTLLLMSEMIEDNDLKEDCLRTRKTVEDKIASFEKMTGKKP